MVSIEAINTILAEVALRQPLFFYCVFAVLGGVFGSLITCAVWRVPRGESMWAPPSHCPKCNHKLGFIDLIPLFSWLMQIGKCRYCEHVISPKYLLIELVSIFISVMVYMLFGAQISAFIAMGFALSAFFVLLVYVLSQHKSLKVLLFSFILFVFLIML